MALWLYEKHKASTEPVLDPCDPTNPEYNVEACPKLEGEAPPGERTYGMGGSMASGGLQYYYPYPSAQPPAVGGTEALPPEEAPTEPAVQEPPSGTGETQGEIVSTGSGGQQHKEPVRGETITNPANQTGWCGHPNAVGTGNACVNGGVGGHTAPAGWHLFCCNGMIGRAPEVVAISPGRPAPAPPPSNPGSGSGGGSGGGGAPANPGGGWCGHPDAVGTGNQCVNGGVGGHTAPNGYHLFCCNGMIGRAPN